MAIGGGSQYTPNPQRQAENAADMAALQPYDPATLLQALAISFIQVGGPSLEAINRYQVAAEPGDLVKDPMPTFLQPDVVRYFTQNTREYDDTIESAISADPVFEKLMGVQGGDERIKAFRARRTVVVLSLLALRAAEDSTNRFLKKTA